MILKIHSRGKGAGAGPVGYLLGKNYDREKARLLRGDPDETIALIDSLDFARTYTSGVLSFEEFDIDEELKDEVIDSFEAALFPHIEKDNYRILWVEHQDKGRLELNFVIPNVELKSGHRLQPYWHPVDGRRLDVWKNLTNAEFNFSDPNEPGRRRALSPSPLGGTPRQRPPRA